MLVSQLEKMLKKEFEWFKENQEALVKSYNGKVLAIKNQKVIGVFDNDLEAYSTVAKDHRPGTFLLQQCIPGEKAYTKTFRTRVVF